MDLTKIDVPFGQLPKETKIALFTAWLDGKSVEYKNPSGRSGQYLASAEWRPVNFPSWNTNHHYRIVATKPSIDWSHVSKKFVAMATDRDGLSFLYQSVPSIDGGSWSDKRWPLSKVGLANCFSSFMPGNCDWKDSLVLRPEDI